MEDVLQKKVPVKVKGKTLFTFQDFGLTSRDRASTIEYKEPETLEWIDKIDGEGTLFDIGANIGIFSLYAAATKNIRTIAFEPQFLNFALLTLNCIENNFNELISCFPICLGDQLTISELNMFLGSGWGTANSTFGRKIDSQGDLRNFEISHGSIGLTLDYFVKEFKVNPSHIKIDVDGNELLVLKGAHETLSNAHTESLLIELCTTHKEYNESIKLIESFGFNLAKKGVEKKNTLNHIYYKS